MLKCFLAITLVLHWFDRKLYFEFRKKKLVKPIFLKNGILEHLFAALENVCRNVIMLTCNYFGSLLSKYPVTVQWTIVYFLQLYRVLFFQFRKCLIMFSTVLLQQCVLWPIVYCTYLFGSETLGLELQIPMLFNNIQNYQENFGFEHQA